MKLLINIFAWLLIAVIFCALMAGLVAIAMSEPLQ